MSDTTAPEVITDFYALRSQAGVVRVKCERSRRLQLAAKLAHIQGCCTEAIAELSRLEEPAEIKPT